MVVSVDILVLLVNLLVIITHSVQVVRKTGLHPHDPGCQQASAEVSLSKTPQRRQLKASVVQPSFTSDLTLSENLGFLVR